MNKTIIFLLCVIIFSIMNFVLWIKTLKYLKPEYESMYYKLLFNFAFPKKEYFTEKGWKLWKMGQVVGIIGAVLFIVILFTYMINN